MNFLKLENVFQILEIHDQIFQILEKTSDCLVLELHFVKYAIRFQIPEISFLVLGKCYYFLFLALEIEFQFSSTLVKIHNKKYIAGNRCWPYLGVELVSTVVERPVDWMKGLEIDVHKLFFSLICEYRPTKYHQPVLWHWKQKCESNLLLVYRNVKATYY